MAEFVVGEFTCFRRVGARLLLPPGAIAGDPGGLATRMRVIMSKVERGSSVNNPPHVTLAAAVWKEV